MNRFSTLLIILTFIVFNSRLSAQVQPVQTATASNQESANPAENAFDGDFNTRWSGSGIGVTLTIDLGSEKNFDQLRIAFLKSDVRWAQFDLEISNNGSTWSPISNNTYQSTVGSPVTEFEDFNFTNQYARYIRYIGQGNQENYWTSILEMQIVNASTSDDSGNTADTQTPTAPMVTNTGQSQTTVDLSWSDATDNVGVTGYTVFQNDVELQTNITSTTYHVTGLAPSTTYNFKVKAYDAAGNQSADSNILAITTDTGGTPGTSVWTESNTTASYSGEVAVGRSTVPSGYKLAVEGNVRAREIRVDTESWPDYVFSKGYDLPNLEDIQKHIEEKGHLPNIPSAKEVHASGIALGEMNRLLLEKIEELTLYVLQLKSNDKEQKGILIKQEDQIESLEKTVIQLKKSLNVKANQEL